MPAWHTASGDNRVMSRPSNFTLPPVAALRPEITSKSVVLPAPLGQHVAGIDLEAQIVDRRQRAEMFRHSRAGEQRLAGGGQDAGSVRVTPSSTAEP